MGEQASEQVSKHVTTFNGIDVSALSIETDVLTRPVVPGRVLQLDADQICYTAGCYDDESFAQAKANFNIQVETWRILAGAESVVLHMTGPDKGGRYEIAKVKEYQAHRKNAKKPKHLYPLRAWVLDNKHNALYHEHQEADDGMCQANYAAVQRGERDLSIICSGDKDLRMCQGLHLDQRTGEIVNVDGYGYITLTGSSPKKVEGYGTAFFFAQLLMGDPADNIPGLPAMGPETRVMYPEFRTKALNKLLDKCEGDDIEAADEAARKIDALPHKKLGSVAAYTILKECKDDFEAFCAVLNAYRAHYGHTEFNFTDFRGNRSIETAGSMLLEQADLLWMRRTVEDRAQDFFKEISNARRKH